MLPETSRVLAQTLFSCLLANKTLSRLAKPVLYHTINHKDLFSVAHHLAHNPALADRVRELSAYERSCHDFVRVMDEDGDRQWPEYLRNRLSAFRSCFADPHSHEDNITSGFRIPIATFALLVCTKIQTLVMHSISSVPPALVERFIKGCLDINPNYSKNTHVPLASLREFTLRYPPLPREPGPEHEDDANLVAGLERKGSDWLSGFIQLPQLEPVTLHRLPELPWHFQACSSGPKRLMLTDRGWANVRTRQLEDVLKACPQLECVDANWGFSGEGQTDMEFARLGAAVTRHGSSLRKLTLHYHYKTHLDSGVQPTPINLASLSHLRDLQLPVEALLPKTPYVYRGPVTDEDEYYHRESRSEEEPSDPPAPAYDVNTSTVSLCQLLPYSLQHLIITDDRYLLADTIRLDKQLRNLILDTQFSELRAIRVRRRIPWSEHVKDLGWHAERYGRYWNALVRP